MFSRRLEKFVDQRTGLPEIRLIIGNQTDDTFTRVDVRWRFRAAEVPPPSPKKPSQKNVKPKATKRSKSGAAKYAGPRRPIQSTIYSLEPLGDGSIPPNEEIAFAIGPQWLNEVLSASRAKRRTPGPSGSPRLQSDQPGSMLRPVKQPTTTGLTTPRVVT